jgi:hypothetical protein
MPGGRAKKKEQCHGRTGRKKLGGRKKFAQLFWIVPELSKNFPETLSKIVVDGGEGGNDYEKFLLDSIFPTKLTEFPTKLTEFKPILPNCEANIARLALFARGCRPPPARYAHEQCPTLGMKNKTNAPPPGRQISQFQRMY